MVKPEHKLKSVDSKSRFPPTLYITVQCLLSISRRLQEGDVTDRAEEREQQQRSWHRRERRPGTRLVGSSAGDAAGPGPDRREMCMTYGLVKF